MDNGTSLTTREYVCDCSCASAGLASRHHASTASARAESLLDELRYLIRSDAVGACLDSCPALRDFRRLFRGAQRDQRFSALEKVTKGHVAAHPCEHERLACIRMGAWQILRASSLITDLASLAACDSDGVRRARRALRACARAPPHPFAHVQMYHSKAKHGKTYSPSPTYLGMALDGTPRDAACDLELKHLAPSLTRYHSGVLGEAAGTIALGLGAACLRLPEWLSLASWKQASKGFPLPCANLTSAPFAAVPRGTGTPTALVYSHWDEKYVRQGVAPAWAALFTDELGVAFDRSTTFRVPRMFMAFDALPFISASHVCCSYLIARQPSVRALAKMLVMLLMRVYVHAVPTAAARTAVGVLADAPATHARARTSNKGRPWWAHKAFAWARDDWATFDGARGCWPFEGRPRAPQRASEATSAPPGVGGAKQPTFGKWLPRITPRNEGALSYLGESGVSLYLYLTHRLVSLGDPPPRTPGGPPRLSVNNVDARLRGMAADCTAARVNQSAVHKDLFGRTSIGAIEAAYERWVHAYSLHP